jgi:hypothetical protein
MRRYDAVKTDALQIDTVRGQARAIRCNCRLTAFGLLVSRLAVFQMTAVVHPVVQHPHDKNA